MGQLIKNRIAWVSVEAVMAGVLLSTQAFASTGPSWSQAPAWTADDAPGAHRTVRSREPRKSEVSPYSPGSHNLALDLGQVFLMGDLTKYNDSIGSQLHYTYGVSDLFGFDTSVGYSEHSDGKYSMTTVLTGMRLNLAWYDKVVPYLIFGLGFYRPSYQDNTVPPIASGSGSSPASVSSVLFGVHLGPGVDLELSKNLFFGAGVTFHNMFGSSKFWGNGTPLNIGGSYTSFLLHIGATF